MTIETAVAPHDFRRRVVLGTPITPRRLLPTLKDPSFCVSFAAPEQLDECIELVDPKGILMLDNGAFSHWRAGKGKIDRELFWSWANAAQARCDVAVAVIPDVIGGSEAENLEECSYAVLDGGLADFPERVMPVWHLNDSLKQLEIFCRLFNFVAFGSCGEYDVQRNRHAFKARIAEAFAVVDKVERDHGRRPWLHLMRGLGVLGELPRFESADSTNLAVNHSRLKPKHGDDRARVMHDRIRREIDESAGICEVEECEPVSNFDGAPTRRPR